LWKLFSSGSGRGTGWNISGSVERTWPARVIRLPGKAVLVALEDVIAEALQNGEIVRLGDLCTLQVSLSGKGAMTEEEYTTDLIKKSRVNFRPGPVLANALASLSFSKVAVKYPKEETEGEDEEVEEGA